jgi:hypothetical protein
MFYHDNISGATSWQKPDRPFRPYDADEEEEEEEDREDHEEQKEANHHGGWEEHWSAEKSRYYYHNSATSVTTWTRPAEMDAAPASPSPSSTPPTDSSSYLWEAHWNKEHQRWYFVSTTTDETVWEKPAATDAEIHYHSGADAPATPAPDTPVGNPAGKKGAPPTSTTPTGPPPALGSAFSLSVDADAINASTASARQFHSFTPTGPPVPMLFSLSINADAVNSETNSAGEFHRAITPKTPPPPTPPSLSIDAGKVNSETASAASYHASPKSLSAAPTTTSPNTPPSNIKRRLSALNAARRFSNGDLASSILAVSKISTPVAALASQTEDTSDDESESDADADVEQHARLRSKTGTDYDVDLEEVTRSRSHTGTTAFKVYKVNGPAKAADKPPPQLASPSVAKVKPPAPVRRPSMLNNMKRAGTVIAAAAAVTKPKQESDDSDAKLLAKELERMKAELALEKSKLEIATLRAELAESKRATQEVVSTALAPAAATPAPSLTAPTSSAETAAGSVGEWIETEDAFSGASFYTNTVTHETTWTKPGTGNTVSGGRVVYLEEKPPVKDDGDEWEVKVDAASGHTYYTNKATRRATWTDRRPPPPPKRQSVPAALPEEKKLTPEAGEGWEEAVDEASGHKYYTDKATKRATWTAPPSQPTAAPEAFEEKEESSEWEEGVDEASGHKYYTNKASKRATWTAPQPTFSISEAAETAQRESPQWEQSADEASGHMHLTDKSTKRATWTDYAAKEKEDAQASNLAAANAAAAAAADVKAAISAAQQAAKNAVSASRRSSLSDVWTKHEDFMTGKTYRTNGHGDVVWDHQVPEGATVIHEQQQQQEKEEESFMPPPAGRKRLESESQEPYKESIAYEHEESPEDSARIAVIMAEQEKMKALVKSKAGESFGAGRVEAMNAKLIHKYASAMEKLKARQATLGKLQRQAGGHTTALAEMQNSVSKRMEETEKKIHELDDSVNRSVSIRKRGEVSFQGSSINGKSKTGSLLTSSLKSVKSEQKTTDASKRQPFMIHANDDVSHENEGGQKGRRRLSMLELTCGKAVVTKPAKKTDKNNSLERSRLGSTAMVDSSGTIRQIRRVSFAHNK